MDFEELADTSKELKELEDKINMVLDYADENPDFDPEFAESLAEQFEESGSLSEKQIDALNNIIARWDIS